jgi:predicted esterase
VDKIEFVFQSLNTEHFLKPITVFALTPDSISSNTGIMLFTHGWGGNRYQHQAQMEYTCEKYDLICLSTEYRQSSFDFDPVRSNGSLVPYDASFYQVFDVLNTLRTSLSLYPGVDRTRLYHYGGSQGGHIALLSGIFAPSTFSFIYATSPMTHIDKPKYILAGRDLSPWEMAIRDVAAHAEKIRCPIFLEHGISDDNVPCDTHTKALEIILKKHGKSVFSRYYENAGHNLQPATTRFDAFKAMMSDEILDMKREYPDDFITGNKIDIPSGNRMLHIDWSRKVSDASTFAWRDI